MKFIFVLIFAVGLLLGGYSCGAGDCEVDGVYNVSAVELSGNCGPFPSITAQVKCGGQPLGDCEGTNIWDADCCGVNFDATCSAASVALSLEGRLSFSEGGDRGEGKMEIAMVTSDGQSCLSTYRFLYQK